MNDFQETLLTIICLTCVILNFYFSYKCIRLDEELRKDIENGTNRRAARKAQRNR